MKLILNNPVFPVVSIIYLHSVRFVSSGRSSDFRHFLRTSSKHLCGSAKYLITRRSWSCPPARGAETNINKQTRQSRKMSDTSLLHARPAQQLFDAAQQHAPVLASSFFFQSQLKVSCNINVGVVLEMTSIPNALSETHCILLLLKCWISYQIYGCSILKS